MTRQSKSYHRAVAHNEMTGEPRKLQTDFGKVMSTNYRHKKLQHKLHAYLPALAAAAA